MDRTADVVIVGGGVIGASIAFHLTRLGVSDVVILEREDLAAGATGKSGALVRMHYTDAPEARLAVAALPWFEEWDDRVGGSCGFVQTGFVQLVAAEDADRLRANVDMLTGLGVTTSALTAAELKAMDSGLGLADDEAGAYEPRGGYADPVATTQSLAAAAVRAGAELTSHTAVRRLLVSGDRVTGVETNAGSIRAGTVILANGAWSVPLASAIGLDLPILSLSAEVVFVSRPGGRAGVAGHMAMIDRRTGIYARPNGDSETLVGISRSAFGIESPDDAHVSDSFPASALKQLTTSMPMFAGEQVVGSRAGPLDVTPDYAAVLGPVDGYDGLVLAVGMSGSGFKKAPAIGSCIAELVAEGATRTAPINEFALSRFAAGQLLVRNDYVVGGEPGSGPALIH